MLYKHYIRSHLILSRNITINKVIIRRLITILNSRYKNKLILQLYFIVRELYQITIQVNFSGLFANLNNQVTDKIIYLVIIPSSVRNSEIELGTHYYGHFNKHPIRSELLFCLKNIYFMHLDLLIVQRRQVLRFYLYNILF